MSESCSSSSSSHAPSSCDQTQAPEICVVLAVADAEERVGFLVKAIAEQIRQLNRRFEIIAVNEGCHDNSLSVLRLLSAQIPELRILGRSSARPLGRSAAGRSYMRGITEAQGPMVVLVDAERCSSVTSLGWALERLDAGREAVVVRGAFIAARKLIALPAMVRAGGPSPLHERLFERAAGQLGIDVAGTLTRRSSGVIGSVLRFLAA